MNDPHPQAARADQDSSAQTAPVNLPTSLPVPPDWALPSVPAPSAYPPTDAYPEITHRPQVQIGRRFLAWLFVILLMVLSRVLRELDKPAPVPAPDAWTTGPGPSPTSIP
jgi:hypothetical protein